MLMKTDKNDKQSKKLTESVVTKLKFPDIKTINPIYCYDTEIKGFCVRLYPTGRKSYALRYRNTYKKSKTIIIGDCADWKLADARKKAQQLKVDVDKGLDPSEARKQERQSETLDEFFQSYIRNKAQRTKSWERDKQRYRDHIKNSFGTKPLKAIDVRDLNLWIYKLQEKNLSNATINRCLALLGHCYSEAIKQGLVNANPIQHIQKFKENKFLAKILTQEEVVHLLKAMNAETNCNYGALFKILLLTGRRVGEIMSLQWTDVDFANKKLIFRQTKAGEPQSLAIGEGVIACLQGLKRVHGSNYVFTGPDGIKKLNAYHKAWRRVLANAGMEYFKLHTLRHNAATKLLADGVSAMNVSKQLGHKSLQTIKHYEHLSIENTRVTAGKLESTYLS